MNPITMKLVVDDLILQALREDITFEDVSTASVCPTARPATVELIAKADGIIAGLDVFARTFELLDPQSSVLFDVADGDEVHAGDHVGQVRGDARVLLSGERVALNYLQRMSGIATMTRRYVERLEGTGAHVLDTRKTTPGLRILEKQAVKAGVSEDVAAAAFSGKNEYLDWLTASNNYTILRPELFNSSGAFSSPTLTINGEYWDLKQLTLADTNMVDGFLKSIGLDADQVGVEGKMPSIGASGKPISVAS